MKPPTYRPFRSSEGPRGRVPKKQRKRNVKLRSLKVKTTKIKEKRTNLSSFVQVPFVRDRPFVQVPFLKREEELKLVESKKQTSIDSFFTITD